MGLPSTGKETSNEEKAAKKHSAQGDDRTTAHSCFCWSLLEAAAFPQSALLHLTGGVTRGGENYGIAAPLKGCRLGVGVAEVLITSSILQEALPCLFIPHLSHPRKVLQFQRREESG